MGPKLRRAVIADDEPLLRAELRERLAVAWPELQLVDEAADGRAALASVMRHRPDVVFLDVNMPRMDGMSAAQKMREQGYGGEIVFVTAYDQYALRAFEQRAVDYLVKPLEAARLCETVERLQVRLSQSAPASGASPALLQELQQAIAQSVAHAVSGALSAGHVLAPAQPEPMPWLRVLKGPQIQLVAIEDVACFRAVPGYTQVTTRDGEHLISEPLAQLLARLDPKTFVQIHRATIVNLRFIAKIQRERPGHFVVELKHGLGALQASRAGAEILREL